MAESKLSEIVRAGVPQSDAHLVPVIEKELLHYDVLYAMEKLGLLEQLVFHGGTCLRLCYGAQRRSEDLDFAYDGNLEDLDLAGLESCVNEALEKKYALKAVIRPPHKTAELATAKMQRWWMVVDTAPERLDLPSQKLKIELVAIKTFTKEVRRIARNYDYLVPSLGNTLAVCETLGEILTDKMVAFVNSPPTYVRNRDAWDMMFLLSQSECNRSKALELVEKKKDVYGCSLSPEEFAQEGEKRVREVVGSPGFAKEMKRFMPEGVFEEMLGTSMKQQFAIDEICKLYRGAV